MASEPWISSSRSLRANLRSEEDTSCHHQAEMQHRRRTHRSYVYVLKRPTGRTAVFSPAPSPCLAHRLPGGATARGCGAGRRYAKGTIVLLPRGGHTL